MTAFLATLILLLLHVMNLISRFPGPWLLIVSTSVLVILSCGLSLGKHGEIQELPLVLCDLLLSLRMSCISQCVFLAYSVFIVYSFVS